MTAAVAIPTKHRADYLDVALRSLAPQCAAHGAELLVVDDGPDDATRAVAERHGAAYVAHDPSRGLNAARNTAVEHTTADLLCLVDDDVEAHEGWLAALLEAAERHPEVEVFTGPILARLEHALRFCGREGPPVTHTDLGAAEQDVRRAWGANLAIRRSAFERIGTFDAGHRTGAGDEEEWERRLEQAGGRIRYIPGAALDHRRSPADARVPALARAARFRGRSARRYDVSEGRAPGLGRELRVLAGSLVHGPRFRCANGPILAAHAFGRVEEALRPTPARDDEDFLSGGSGTVGGRRGRLRAAADVLLDRGWRRGPRRSEPRRRVLVLGIERPGNLMGAVRAELERSHHDVTLVTAPPGERGKFENLNALLASCDVRAHDWLLVVDDDVVLPPGFLDRFLALAERAGLRLAQPAHRLASHAAWPVTRRRPASLVRETSFVEIGPVTAFHADTFDALLPFPDLRMGWGLDVHWAAVARERAWKLGVVDATPILHTVPTAATYPREAALAEARAFLADRPYVRRDEAVTLRVHR